mgnify:FL=1
MAEFYLRNNQIKPEHSYVRISINDRELFLPLIDDIRIVSEDGCNFDFEPTLRLDKTYLAIDLYKTMLSESKLNGYMSNYLDAGIELIRSDKTSFSAKFRIPHTKLSLGSYMLADIATYLTPRLLIEPKIKYMGTNKTYLFVNSDTVEYPLYSDDEQYRFALEFKVHLLQFNQSIDVIVASTAKPYVDYKMSEPKDDNFIGELAFRYERQAIGKVYDGNEYFILDFGNWLLPFNGDYEFGGVMPLKLDVLDVSELTSNLIDDICTKAAKRR